jgi:DNA-binding transcriptional MocR family regulator
MSYKVDLSTLQRDGDTSLTQQLVERFVAAIEDGVLEPGEKLPPTRELAAHVGVNHLTAARVYRKLAELGYVTASVGRGTFVRTLAPAGSDEYGDDWQVYALPQWEMTYPQQVLADAFASGGQRGLISLAVGWPSPRLFPTAKLARITAEIFEEEGGEALSHLPAEGLCPFASSSPRAAAIRAGPRTRTRSSSPRERSRRSASYAEPRSRRATWR